MIKLYNADCLEVLKSMPDKSIDCIITDPPYGIGTDGQKKSICKNPKHNRKYHEFMGWDNKTPNKIIFDEMFRVSKNQIIFGGNYFELLISKGWIVWDKGQKGLTMSDSELIWTSFNKPLRIFICNRCELRKDGSHHPTMKPLKLLQMIFEKYVKENDIILDPFMGSGSVNLQAFMNNNKTIGIEKEKKYYDIAVKRIQDAGGNVIQQRLYAADAQSAKADCA